MGPTWVLSAPDGSRVGPMNFAIRGICFESTGGLYHQHEYRTHRIIEICVYIGNSVFLKPLEITYSEQIYKHAVS